MAGESDALKGKVSESALEALEIFTRHGGLNHEDLQGWREFVVQTYLDGQRAPRESLREHLQATRRDDSPERIEIWLDEYDEALAVLKTYDELARHARP